MAQTSAEMVRAAAAIIENVSPQEAFDEMASNGAVLVDIREPVEWERHIAGAVQVPRGILEFAADPASPRHRANLDPNRRVIVYCRSGSRSALATQMMESLGYDDVANLAGGITARQEAGLPIVEHHEGL